MSSSSDDEDRRRKSPPKAKTEDRQKRLAELRLKINQGKNKNKEAALEEYQRKTEGDAAVEERKRREAWLERKAETERDEAANVIEKVNPDLNVTAAHAEAKEKKRQKKEKNQAAYGWEMYNIESQVQTYKKRIKNVRESFSEPIEGGGSTAADIQLGVVSQPTDEMRERLKAELAVTLDRRGKFSRRRGFNDDATVNYINERNKKFNDKLDRSFDTSELRRNIERGTA
eukprot:TRINITY_DN33659_c0_g1_i1.p1 TRINITY_DN33659_c0_g1~~TRINITY_DN33659_c0_g1_i1.p1  ORF type:complete len:242 (+),score=69.79 TRINITY_DN33659_c0_g1_i1:41-727(+)